MTNKQFVPDAAILLTPAEAADRFRVDVKTLSRWAKAGKLRSVRTVGGHRRYLLSDIDELLTFSYEEPK